MNTAFATHVTTMRAAAWRRNPGLGFFSVVLFTALLPPLVPLAGRGVLDAVVITGLFALLAQALRMDLSPRIDGARRLAPLPLLPLSANHRFLSEWLGRLSALAVSGPLGLGVGVFISLGMGKPVGVALIAGLVFLAWAACPTRPGRSGPESIWPTFRRGASSEPWTLADARCPPLAGEMPAARLSRTAWSRLWVEFARVAVAWFVLAGVLVVIRESGHQTLESLSSGLVLLVPMMFHDAGTHAARHLLGWPRSPLGTDTTLTRGLSIAFLLPVGRAERMGLFARLGLALSAGATLLGIAAALLGTMGDGVDWMLAGVAAPLAGGPLFVLRILGWAERDGATSPGFPFAPLVTTVAAFGAMTGLLPMTGPPGAGTLIAAVVFLVLWVPALLRVVAVARRRQSPARS